MSRSKKLLEDLEYLALMTPIAPAYKIVLVGCGGTGSWLAPALVRLIKVWNETHPVKSSLIFVDPDIVEEKNCYRQNFSYAEIGRNKAETLAFRYSLGWAERIKAYPISILDREFSWYNFGSEETLVVIGCVDNYQARKSMASFACRNRLVYIDCGNDREVGQVALGTGDSVDLKNMFSFPGKTTWFPPPFLQYPDLFVPQEEVEETPDAGLSCAELALRGSQNLMINQVVAALAGNMLYRLMFGSLNYYAASVDLNFGVQFEFATQNRIKTYVKKVGK